jgi:hypothetical protein
MALTWRRSLLALEPADYRRKIDEEMMVFQPGTHAQKNTPRHVPYHAAISTPLCAEWWSPVSGFGIHPCGVHPAGRSWSLKVGHASRLLNNYHVLSTYNSSLLFFPSEWYLIDISSGICLSRWSICLVGQDRESLAVVHCSQKSVWKFAWYFICRRLDFHRAFWFA